jgi:hypothetical protein
MLSRLRVLGPASVAFAASVLVWLLTSAADTLDVLYPLNMATQASIDGYLFIGAAAGAFAAVEAGIARRHPASRLVDASGARPPVVIAVHRLTPVIGWFSLALIAVIVGAALRGQGPTPLAQVAAVVVAAVAALWLAIGMGAVAGRYLPFGLGPLLGLLSTYALYVPAVLSGGRGPWAVVPIMDTHPAPYSLVRPGAYLLGAGLLTACAALLVAFAGPRVGHRLVPVGAAAVGLAVTIPLASGSPRDQEAVFLEPADLETACVAYRGSSLCVLDVDDRFLGTLQEGAAIAWPILEKYSIEPDRIAQVDAPGAGSTPTVEVDVRSLAAGPRATAANIINSAVAGSCEMTTIEPVAAMPWDIILGAVLRAEAGLAADEPSGGEPAQRLESLPQAEREEQVREAIAAIRTCQVEHP